MRLNDIQIYGNSISGRQGWAYTCNSGNIPILKVNLDAPQEYDDYQTFDMVRIAWTDRHGNESYSDGQLECSEGKWQIGGWGFGIHSQFGFSDMANLINRSQRQIIAAGQIVALACFSQKSKIATLNLYKVGKVDIFCQTIASLTPLTDAEMWEVTDAADRWCNR